MSSEEIESRFNVVLSFLQLCLGIWQFINLTPVGALIKGGIGWLLRPLGLSPTYSLLQECRGRVFKEANCFVLQADIPAERRDIESDQVNSLNFEYLGETFVLKREGGNNIMSFFGKGNKEIKYYITDKIWKELQNLKKVLSYGCDGPPFARAAVTRAAAERAECDARDQEINVQRLKAEAQSIETRTKAEALCDSARCTAADACAAAARAEIDAASRTTVFVKGKREFWNEIITGGVMTFEEVMDAIILYNQHVSARPSSYSLLPINLSVSEKKFLVFLNLVALFLQIKQVVKVHWSIPFSLSCISAFWEVTTTISRKIPLWLYFMINRLFCYQVHLICDPLPRSWRRRIYSLAKWVEGLSPSNDIQLKVVRGTMCAIITSGAKIIGGAKVLKEDEKLDDWLGQPLTPLYGVIEKQFRCDPIDSDIRCTFVIDHKLCEIFTGSFPVFYVKCNEEGEFRKIITLVSCIARNGCGSLISYGPNNKVRVRGFEETVACYVNSGLPSIYTLNLENVIVD